MQLKIKIETVSNYFQTIFDMVFKTISWILIVGYRIFFVSIFHYLKFFLILFLL